MSQGLEDITAIGSAPNIVNVNVSLSHMRPHSAVQVVATVSDLRPSATAVQQTSVTGRSPTGMTCSCQASCHKDALSIIVAVQRIPDVLLLAAVSATAVGPVSQQSEVSEGP